MALKKEKYINALLYFISNCSNEKLGLTKLNKLFYYLDFISYRDNKESVTGETYLHLQMGPFASQLQGKIIKEAEKQKFITQDKDESEKFGKRNRYQALVASNTLVFSAYEKKLLDNICRTFKDWNTDQMIAQTHSEAPWVFSEANKSLDYKNADDIEFFLQAKSLAISS
jgi:uncharacterized phage-associated protein